MKNLLRKLLSPLFIWLADKFSAAPKRDAVFKSLSKLYQIISSKGNKKGIVINIDPYKDHFIIFSDQHKGNRSFDDDFLTNESNYLAALQYYHQQQYSFINLGDAEELWKNKADVVVEKYTTALQAEAAFQTKDKYFRTFGNHDLLWKNGLDVTMYLRKLFTMPLPVYEGMVLKVQSEGHHPLDIFLTHGHQGDVMSDNNAFSTWMIAHIWAPLQRLLHINVNTPANDFQLRNKHNRMMYEWSSERKHLLLITGHTHKPVFASGKYADKEIHKIESEKPSEVLKPTYFNTGCCCFNDGDITGIEIADGFIRLIKWQNKSGNNNERVVLDEKLLEDIIKDMEA